MYETFFSGGGGAGEWQAGWTTGEELIEQPAETNPDDILQKRTLISDVTPTLFFGPIATQLHLTPPTSDLCLMLRQDYAPPSFPAEIASADEHQCDQSWHPIISSLAQA